GYVADQEGKPAVAQGEEVVQVAGDVLGGVDGGEDLTAAVRRGGEVGRQKAELDLAAQGQVAVQSLGAAADGVQRDVLNHGRGQHAHGGQQTQVLARERPIGLQGVELDRAQRLAVAADQRDADQGGRFDVGQGGAAVEPLISVGVFTQDPAA